jgi:hypothetical protein
VLDPGERLNEESMYAIYEKDNRKLGLLEEENEEPFDLNEVEPGIAGSVRARQRPARWHPRRPRRQPAANVRLLPGRALSEAGSAGRGGQRRYQRPWRGDQRHSLRSRGAGAAPAARLQRHPHGG